MLKNNFFKANAAKNDLPTIKKVKYNYLILE